MTQEDKELLLKDICARLPFGVRVKSSRRRMPVTLSLDVMTDFRLGCSIKPYLRPMDSMTEEEYKELKSISSYYGFAPYESIGDWCPNYEMVDWCNKNHFDFRGLIPKGLALEAPEGMYN